MCWQRSIIRSRAETARGSNASSDGHGLSNYRIGLYAPIDTNRSAIRSSGALRAFKWMVESKLLSAIAHYNQPRIFRETAITTFGWHRLEQSKRPWYTSCHNIRSSKIQDWKWKTKLPIGLLAHSNRILETITRT